MRDAYIVGAARTAIGSFGGTLKDLDAHKLGSTAIRAAVERAGVDPADVDEVIMGCILQSGQGQGPGRQAAMGAGIPEATPAWAINQLCGSGLKTVCLAANAIAAGDGDCYVVGGMESMSRSSHLVDFARFGKKMGHLKVQDSMILDGLTDVFSGEHMGMTAEAIAAKYELSREEQDAFAAESQRRAGVALEENVFADEICAVTIPQRKGDPIVFEKDEYPRPSSTAEKLAKLRPAFKKDGTVTAGNASGINDGAAALVIVSEDFMKAKGLKPLAKIVAHATTALDPMYMGLGPIEASRKALKRADWTVKDLDLIEANEAFASQSLAVCRDLELDPAKTNVNGGAIALGHPIGASGARILVTLLYEMKRRDAKKGLATLCVGGGMGTSLLVERA